VEKTCATCGQSFDANEHWKRFCSRKCKIKDELSKKAPLTKSQLKRNSNQYKIGKLPKWMYD